MVRTVYVAQKTRKNKNDEKVFYLYLAESKRIEGVVKNSQRYALSFKEVELADIDTALNKIESLQEKFSSEEISLIKKKLIELS